MRSKSEVIIANLLKEKNIPYHYEYPVHMKNMETEQSPLDIKEVERTIKTFLF